MSLLIEDLTDRQVEEWLTQWLHENGCSECQNYKKRPIICREGCLGKFIEYSENG